MFISPSKGVLSHAFLCLTFIVFSEKALAQAEADAEDFFHHTFLVSDEGDPSDRYEAWLQLLTNPLDINAANMDELAVFTFLSLRQLQAFFKYRAELGPLLSLYELQAVPELEMSDIRKLLPFISLRTTGAIKLKNPGHNYFIWRAGRLLEQQKGYEPIDSAGRSSVRYVGKPWNWYGRFRYARSGAFSFGFTVEKDSGEQWQWNPGRQIFGADFTSGHAQIQNRGRLKNLIIGDYQIQVGQSLVMGAGFSFGKGAEVISSTYRSTLGLRPYSSAVEAGYFRGIGATISIGKRVYATGLVSYARRDATTEGEGDLSATSYGVAGLHRTATERGRQGNAVERNLGIHLMYRNDSEKSRFGLTMLHTHYSIPVLKKPYPYNLYEFAGKNNLVVGVHGDWRWKIFHGSGEVARSESGGTGFVLSGIAALTKAWDVSFLLRKYDPGFHSFYGNSFAEASRPINETGSYWGIKFSPGRKWNIGAYYDAFYFPWLKYQVNAPSAGSGYLGYVRWAPKRNTRFQILFASEEKEKNSTDKSLTVLSVVSTRKRTCQLSFEHKHPVRFSVRTRFQATDYYAGSTVRSLGFAAMQDGTYRAGKVEVNGRLAYFHTDSFDSRQYIYEKDVLYAFSLPSFQGKGVRYYLMSSIKIKPDIRLWLRWARSRYFDQQTVGSGLDEIKGSKKSEFKMQLMYRL